MGDGFSRRVGTYLSILKNGNQLLTHLQFPRRVDRKFGSEVESFLLSNGTGIVLADDGLIDLN